METMTTRFITAGRWAAGRATRWWPTRAGSTRISGSRAAGGPPPGARGPPRGGGPAAHHSFAAEFDGDKAITVTGIVTKIDWTNPHVWFYFNVKDDKTGEVANWGAEMGPPPLLQRRGRRRGTLKNGG